jgi:hypothetical protein
MADRKFRVLARNTKTNNVKRVYRLANGQGFTRDQNHPKIAKNAPGLFHKDEAEDAKKWGRKKGLAMFVTKSKYPFLVLDSDTKWGDPDLSRKLDELGERRERYLWCGEYKRSKRQQWEFRMAYLNGTGNLAARCDTTYDGKHTWEQCKGAGPSQSNHATGDACDTSYLHSGRSGAYTNVGRDKECRRIMASLDLCLPVGGEPWHVERGTNWKA